MELAKLREWKLAGGWEGRSEYYRLAPGGKWKKRDSKDERFPEKSHKVLQNAKSKLEKILSRSPYDFNIVFLRQGHKKPKKWHNITMRDSRTEGFIKTEKALKFLREEGVEIDSASWRRSINFIMLGTGIGSASLPPTPWIIVHWMTHALVAGFQGDDNDFSEGIRLTRESGLYTALATVMADSYAGKDGDIDPFDIHEDDDYYWEDFFQHAFMPAVFTFRSARAKRLTTMQEGLQDLFTQYMWNPPRKGIQLNRPPKTIEFDGDVYTRKSGAEDAFDAFKKEIESIFKGMLDNAVGKWYYT